MHYYSFNAYGMGVAVGYRLGEQMCITATVVSGIGGTKIDKRYDIDKQQSYLVIDTIPINKKLSYPVRSRYLID